jgi:hypothetical protein
VKVKNISGADLTCEWVPGGAVEADQVVEVPETQPDGSPLIWHPDFWEPVEEKKAIESAESTEDEE